LSILITGGSGFIGTQLARRLIEKGEDVVLFSRVPRLERLDDIKHKLKFIQGDLRVWPEVMNAVRDHQIEGIFHFGALLSTPSEQNPWACFQTNIEGTMHVLEAARLFGVKRVFFASTSGTYGLGIGSVVTEETIQRPTSAYGASKLYGELLGRFYRRKFDLDFRCLRYCAVIGPGARSMMVSQYNSWMIENAVTGKPYECFVTDDIQIPVTYYKDALRATEMLYYAPRENIETVCYNVAGISPARSVKELELAIKKFIPEANIIYRPDPAIMEFFRTYPVKVIDDSRAREEWGWQPLYTDFEKIVKDFLTEVRRRPHHHGLELAHNQL
jgi:threonine 3-dehydrogenase